MQKFFDAARHRFVDHLVNFAVDAFARDEDFFEEGKLLVIIVNLALDEAADLRARRRTRREFREMLDDGRHFRINARLDERDGVGRKQFRERRAALRDFINARTDELADLRFETRFGHQSAKAFFDEAENPIEAFVTDGFVDALRE